MQMACIGQRQGPALGFKYTNALSKAAVFALTRFYLKGKIMQ